MLALHAPLQWRRTTLLICVLALVALVLFGKAPASNRLWALLSDFAHAPVFVALALIVVQLVAGGTRGSRPAWLHYALAFSICLATGMAIEIIQSRIGGDSSVGDVVADAFGSLAGLAAHARFRLPASARPGHCRIVLIMISLASLVAAAWPLLHGLAAYAHRDSLFPVLAVFDTPLDSYFISTPGFVPEVDPIPADLPHLPSERALRVRLNGAELPGVSLDEPSPDWSHYRTLCLDLANPNAVMLPLRLRVHDRLHNQQLEDRFNLSIELRPLERSVLRVRLADIEAAPATRRMDLRHIAGVVIFSRQRRAETFYLVSLWLE